MRYVFAILIAAAVLANGPFSIAQETMHPPGHAFDPYTGLEDSEGNECCHGIHCRPAQYERRGSEHWMSTDNGVTWFQVPAEKEVLPTPDVEKLGGATWCGNAYEDYRETLCWVRPREDPSV